MPVLISQRKGRCGGGSVVSVGRPGGAGLDPGEKFSSGKGSGAASGSRLTAQPALKAIASVTVEIAPEIFGA